MENIIPKELYKALADQFLRIIPSDDVPAGHKRMEGRDIFVSQSNYILLKEMTASQMLIVLSSFRDMASEPPTNGADKQEQ